MFSGASGVLARLNNGFTATAPSAHSPDNSTNTISTHAAPEGGWMNMQIRWDVAGHLGKFL
jgi:hypothetical protein